LAEACQRTSTAINQLVVVEQEISEVELLRIDEGLQDPVLDNNAATHFGGIE
jgi:hypothetical protein